MSHITLAKQGLDAVAAREWDEAVSKLSAALKTSTNPDWLVARSKALVGLGRFAEALEDAELAWHTAYERNKRAALVDAHYRRAVAYYRMGQLANADCCCLYAMRLVKGSPALEREDPKAAWTDGDGLWTATFQQVVDEARVDDFNRGKAEDGMALVTEGQRARAQVLEWRQASTLRMQILRAMEALPAGDAARKVTVSLKPEHRKLADAAAPAGGEPVPEPEAEPKAEAGASVGPPRPAADKAPVAEGPLRLQEFQSSTTMSVSVFSKGVDKEKLRVEFLPSAVRLDRVVYPGGEVKPFSLQLWGEIEPSACKYTVTPNKVELSLAKKTAGKWNQLRRDEGAETADCDGARQLSAAPEKAGGETGGEPSAAPTAASAATSDAEPQASKAPAYPSSSRSGPKDWDKIGADDGDDDENDVNLFFKKLYKNATPEQQRAMMKSFTESNGTSLSTDWNDVKARKVETVPPEGVEAKKWQ